MDAYKQYNLWTPEEKHQFHEEWDKYKESFHNIELQKNIDKLNIEIELEPVFSNHKNDFEITYKDDKQDMDQLFWYRRDLKMLFSRGFKWLVIKEKMQLYKRINMKHKRALRSPNTNICSNDKRDLCLFIKDNLIYVASGRAFYKNNTTQYFNYVGKILNKGEALQLSIFDI